VPRPDEQLRILEADILRVFRTRGEAAALAICTGELAVWSRALVQQDKRRIEAERQHLKDTALHEGMVSFPNEKEIRRA
jgi:hypothetical protein